MDTPPVETKTRRPRPLRNYIAYFVLLACLVAVHFILEFNPAAAKSVAQAAVFSWPALGLFGGLGLVSVFFLNLTRLRGLWDPDLGWVAKLATPALVGLVLGAVVVGIDLRTGWSHVLATEAHVSTIHIAFPLSIPIYFGGAILVTIIYYFLLIPILDWLVALKLLRGRGEPAVFWIAGLLLALVEPVTQGDFTAIPKYGAVAAVAAAGDVVMNLSQVWFLRRSGLIAAAMVRVGFYAVWHVVYGLV